MSAPRAGAMRSSRLAAGLGVALLAGCGGGGGGGSTGDDGSSFSGLTDVPAAESLTAAEVSRIVAQGVAEAAARGAPASFAVVDRVGNVRAVFGMTGGPSSLSVVGLATAAGSGLDGLLLPGAGSVAVGAIAKAITGAYLSSAGNAFSTRTASQIVQENFNPGEINQPGGPLFGVQFSSLPCSDLNTRFAPGSLIGPQRSPLGLSADPGGLPLYKNGVVVGGIGAIADGVYGLDREPRDVESQAANVDELIALAATVGFTPPADIEAPRITVEGKSLRYTDQGLSNDLGKLASNAATAPSLAAVIGAGGGALVSIPSYFDAPGGVRAGSAYGEPASGYVRAATLAGNLLTNQSAFVLVDAAGAPRFAPRAGSDLPGGAASNRLTQAEVTRLLDEGLGVSLAGRAQIRRPLDSRIQVTVSVVDTNGAILGVARTPDAPIFGTDVSLQKARSALFLSSATAAAELSAVGSVDSDVAFPGVLGAQRVFLPPLADYVAATDAFLGVGALRGATAFSERGIGNVARPFYPDGLNGRPNGPLSRPIASADTARNWSPFSTGLQFDLVGANILQHVLFLLGVPGVPDTAAGCTQIAPRDALAFSAPPLANGLQIFAGAVPVYRGGLLVGAIGVSGDGIDQDDMISALGLSRAGAALGGFGHAPAAIRSDRLIPLGVRLRYVSCPFEPFLGSNAQNVCEAL